MKCFYHAQGDGVALCKNCFRALCHACASEVGDAVACKGRCEEEVGCEKARTQRGMVPGSYSTGAHTRNAIFIALMGLLLAAVGILTVKSGTGAFAIAMGLLFLALAGWVYYIGRRTTKTLRT